jgi:hypothetical protein
MQELLLLDPVHEVDESALAEEGLTSPANR